MRVLAGSATFVVMLLLAVVFLLVGIAHRPSPVHGTLTAAEISAEDAYLSEVGLVVRDGTFLKELPFEPPWTSHSLLVPHNWSREPGMSKLLDSGQSRVRADLLLADLDTLQPVMQRAYGGWDSAAARGWNWGSWFAGWRKLLASRGSAEVSFNEAFAPVDALIAFQRDNHTQIPLSRNSTSDGSQTALLTTTPDEPCDEIRAGDRIFPIHSEDPAQQVRSTEVWRTGTSALANAHYLAMPTSMGTSQAVHCGTDWIRLEPVSQRLSTFSKLRMVLTRKADSPRITRVGEGIVYARLPTFSPQNYQNISRQGWPARLPGDRVLVVDLRNNEGGAWGYGLSTLNGWIDEQRMVPWDQFGRTLITSCLYAPLRWNQSIENVGSILPSQKAFLQGLLDRMAQPYPPDCPRTTEEEPAHWTYLQHRFNPKPGDMRIIVLVNSGCGSDCELITAQLSSLRETLVVGTNTYGVGQFIQPGYSVLPHTKLKYRLALGRSNFYGDDRSFDGYGLNVDVVLPEVDELKTDQIRELAWLAAKL
jgi:C-terminal processing protease CtpA/Prc